MSVEYNYQRNTRDVFLGFTDLNFFSFVSDA